MTDVEKQAIYKEMFPSYKVYKEVEKAAKLGKDEHKASDGIRYPVPDFLKADVFKQKYTKIIPPQRPGEAPIVHKPATFMESVIGGAEADLALVTQATTGTVGYIKGTIDGFGRQLGNVIQGKQWDNKAIEQSAIDAMERTSYVPKTEEGKKVTAAVGDVLLGGLAFGPNPTMVVGKVPAISPIIEAGKAKVGKLIELANQDSKPKVTPKVTPDATPNVTPDAVIKSDGSVEANVEVVAQAQKDVATEVTTATPETPMATESVTPEVQQSAQQSVTPEVATEVAPPVPEAIANGSIKEVPFAPLPVNLAKANGFYKTSRVTFANDVQKAVYIAGNDTKPSKNYTAFLNYASEQLGMSPEDVVRLGKAMRPYLEDQLRSRPVSSINALDLSKMNFPTMRKVAVKETGETTATRGNVAAVEEDMVTSKVTYSVTPEQAQSFVDAVNNVDHNAPRTPAEGAKINFEKGGFINEDIAQAIVDENKLDLGVLTDVELERTAMDKLLSFKSIDDMNTYVQEVAAKTENLPADTVTVRMIFANEVNNTVEPFERAKTVQEKVAYLVNNPILLESASATGKVVQQNSTAAGRVLRSQKIPIEQLNIAIGNVADNLKAFNEKVKQFEKNGFTKEETIAAFSEKDLDALFKSMDELSDINDASNRSLTKGLPGHDRAENPFMKLQRTLTEIWLSGNLAQIGTMSAALAGSLIKRSVLKGESYFRWLVGKSFNMAERDKWNEVKAYNEGNYAASNETLRMLIRMITKDTGEGIEGILQRESLDGWNTKWDSEVSHGAIEKGYIGFEDPNTIFKHVVNNVIDDTGLLVRAPFNILTLADDIMKRVYYSPYVKYLATKEANLLFPDSALAHELHIQKTVKAYEVFYSKQGQRVNTMKVAITKEMEEFKKNNPEATTNDIIAAEHMAEKNAEALVKFTAEEEALLKEYPIDPAKHEQAMVHLREMLFQSDIFADNAARKGPTAAIIGSMGKLIHNIPLLQTQLPYIKTVLNMAKDTIQRFPATALLSRDMRADLKAGGIARANAVSKIMMGTAMTAFGAYLYENGFITPTSDPKNYETEAAVRQQGAMIRIPGLDFDIPLNRLDPVGSYLLLSANALQLLEEKRRIEEIINEAKYSPELEADKEILDKMEKSYLAIFVTLGGQIFTEKSGAKGLKDLQDVVTHWDSEMAAQWFKKYATGFVPLHSFMRSVNEGTVSFEAKTWLEHYRQKIGKMSQKYGDRNTINFLGERNDKVQRLGNYWRTSTALTEDPLLTKLYEYQPGFKKMDEKLTLPNGIIIDLDYKDKYELQTYMSHPYVDARGKLQEVLDDKEFQALPLGVAGENVGPFKTKISILNTVYSNIKKAAEGQYIEDNYDTINRKYNAHITINDIKSSNESKSSKRRAKVIEIRKGK